jgi:phosphoribosylglycinamide formyltransferase-1
MKRIALFASGDGSNAEKIILHFKNCDQILVSLVVSTKASAFVVERAKSHSIPSIILNRDQFTKTENLLTELDKHHIDFIVLAGFLWLVPQYLLGAYPNSVINIHPALLPKYGGRGMYGMYIHRAVIDAKERESGITIHYVNEEYDEGKIIFQKSCTIDSNETPESLAEKIHYLEHKHFPEVIEHLLIPK